MFNLKIKKNNSIFKYFYNFLTNRKKQDGFTLVETLIAISILMISVAAPLTLAAQGIQAATLAKQQIIAYYLAQDAYEFIKNKSDTNKMQSSEQHKLVIGMDSCVYTNAAIDEKCEIDTVSGDILERTGDGNKLGFREELSLYGYDDGTGVYVDTIYSRYIQIKKKYATGVLPEFLNEIQVEVVVEWSIPFVGDQRYVLKSNITNW